MRFFVRARGSPARLGIFSGSFNPPTRAHLAVAHAGLAYTDEVVFIVPRVFPHKRFDGASFEERVAMLRACIAEEPRFSVASTRKGLFIEIAHECRQAYGDGVALAFLCGRDAAQRIVEWDYGRPGAIDEMLAVFELLVASRDGVYEPPERLAHRIAPLCVEENVAGISATEVRTRIREGRPWEHLVPAAICAQVREIYG
jgi:nicotinate (nicotinamide) nucleotide adenylyltransferase